MLMMVLHCCMLLFVYTCRMLCRTGAIGVVCAVCSPHFHYCVHMVMCSVVRVHMLTDETTKDMHSAGGYYDPCVLNTYQEIVWPVRLFIVPLAAFPMSCLGGSSGSGMSRVPANKTPQGAFW